MARYDTAITVFSSEGRLLQVDYALEAVKMGSCTIGIKGKDCLVLAVEKQATPKLQDPRTLRKIIRIDDHLCLAFAGLQADARVLTNKASLECQSYRLTFEEPPSVEYVARFIARTQQRFTQKGGVRPFGISCLIVGYDQDQEPKLYQTEPSGSCSAWKANAIGNQSKTVMELLEKKYKEDLELDDAIGLALEAMLDVVENPVKNVELLYMTKTAIVTMQDEDLSRRIEEIKKKKAGGA